MSGAQATEPIRHLFLMDSIASVAVDKDSTFALMLEAQDRGHTLFYALVEELYARDGRSYILAQPTRVQAVQGDHATLGAPIEIALGDVDIVWMRKDPPFHMGYIFNTYLLDYAADDTLIVNAPAGLRAMNEKAWALRFPELCPPTLITQSMARIRAMAEELGTIVVKPLDGNGGEGVFILRKDDPNIGVIVETSTLHGRRKMMAQAYLPQARLGDKRIILIDGVAVGALMRIPQGVDHRGNMHAGAQVAKTTLTDRERQICETIGPWLRDADQLFVGIDVIGDYLTEVNVTSPTGLHEINGFDGVNLQGQIIDAALRRLAARASDGSAKG